MEEPVFTAKPKLHSSLAVRYLLLSLGWIFVLLGAVGAILPLLPTTPFILLAAFCFARGSEKAHGWLLENRIFGPLLRDWENGGAISPRAKAWLRPCWWPWPAIRLFSGRSRPGCESQSER